MTTLRAFTARIPRVHGSGGYPRKSSLVLDKCSELSESPRMQNGSLLVPNRYPATDAAQLFERHTPVSVFSFGNDLLGNDVIYIGREAVLTTGKFPELTTASTSALTLQLGAQPSIPIANSFYGIAAIGSTVRV